MSRRDHDGRKLDAGLVQALRAFLGIEPLHTIQVDISELIHEHLITTKHPLFLPCGLGLLSVRADWLSDLVLRDQTGKRVD